MEFKKMDGTRIQIDEYVKTYTKSHPNTEVIVGCDSQNRKVTTSYAVVVAMYEPGHGAHVVFSKMRSPKEKVRSVRLLNEVYYSIETAEQLRNAGIDNLKCIDIDINPNPKYKSNEVFAQAKGMVEGMGYEVRYKTLCPLVTTMADTLARY